MSWRDIPNTLSLLRMVAALPVAILLSDGQYGKALILLVAAGVSDGLDGYLAKRYAWQSRLGSILDPAADKLLLVTTYLTLGWENVVPWWLALVVVGRDVIVIGGALAYHWLVGQYEMAPTWVSKVNTVMQIILVWGVVASLSVGWVPGLVIKILVLMVLVTTLWSGTDYAWTWGTRAYHLSRRRQH